MARNANLRLVQLMKGEGKWARRSEYEHRKSSFIFRPSYYCFFAIPALFVAFTLDCFVDPSVEHHTAPLSCWSTFTSYSWSAYPNHKHTVLPLSPRPHFVFKNTSLNDPGQSTSHREPYLSDIADEQLDSNRSPPQYQALPVSTNSTISSSHSTDSASSFHPPVDYPHRCYLQTISDPSELFNPYPFNARSFCLASSVCFRPSISSNPSVLYHSAPLDRTSCVETAADFQPHGRQQNNCSYIRSLVHQAHGYHGHPIYPVPPQVVPMSELGSHELASARWLQGLVFYVPAYPHLDNIYHFSFVAGAISHILAASKTLMLQWRGEDFQLPQPLPVTIVFRDAQLPSHGLWQQSIMEIIVTYRLKLVGIDVQYTTMNETNSEVPASQAPEHLTCSKTAILLGTRSNVNVWPFPTSVEVQTDGSSVPVEAVAFRRAAYNAVAINSMLPSLPHGASGPLPLTAMFDLPPLVIGYSSRNSYPDPKPGEPIYKGSIRRFSDADDVWFTSMLRDVATAHNFSFTVLKPTNNTAMSEQVKSYAKVGFIAGIHGANLMNVIFMKPFGGILEVFPQSLQCYVAGANSGLKYSHYIPVHAATPEESRCPENHPSCWIRLHMRRVMIGTETDRRSLRRMVEDEVSRIVMLHKRFGALGGIPVYYNRTSTSYQIDWNQQSS